MKTLNIMVSPNKMVIDPKSLKRLEEGKTYTVPGVLYWYRMLKCGDVVLVDKKKVEKPKKIKPKKEPLKVEEKKDNSKEMGE